MRKDKTAQGEKPAAPDDPVGGQQPQLSTATNTAKKMPCTRGAESHRGGRWDHLKATGNTTYTKTKEGKPQSSAGNHIQAHAHFSLHIPSFPSPQQPLLTYVVQEDTITSQHCHPLFISHTLTLFLSLFWLLEIYSTWRCIFQSPRLTWFNY